MYFGLYYNKDASWCYSGGVGFYEMQYLWRKPWNAEEMKTYNSLMVTAAIRKKDWEEVGGCGIIAGRLIKKNMLLGC